MDALGDGSAGFPALAFSLGRRDCAGSEVPKLVRTRRSAVKLSHRWSSQQPVFFGDAGLILGAAPRPHRRQNAFASLSLGGPAAQQSQGAKVPLFMLAAASSDGKKPSSSAKGKKGSAAGDAVAAASPAEKPAAPAAPAWRVTLGNLAAGAIAGCAVEAALYPIDTIKTRLQAMIGGGGLKALLQQGGGKALYAGVWGNLAGVAPASAIFISVYEPVKKAVEASASPEQKYLGSIVAGAAAGTVSSLVRVPTEVVKQRLQTKEFAGAIQAIKAILGREGLRGMYAGYGAFMLRDLPFDAIEFFVYEQLKVKLQQHNKRELQPHETSLIGAFAGGFTGLVTTPLDVLKTRLMTQGASGTYRNLFDATARILKEEGAAAFMKGWQPRLIWISLGGFVFFPVLEAAKKALAPPGAEPSAPSGH